MALDVAGGVSHFVGCLLTGILHLLGTVVSRLLHVLGGLVFGSVTDHPEI